MAAPSTDLLKSFGAELLAALPRTDAPAQPQGMRSAAEELEVARTLSACGDLAGAEATLRRVTRSAFGMERFVEAIEQSTKQAKLAHLEKQGLLSFAM